MKKTFILLDKISLLEIISFSFYFIVTLIDCISERNISFSFLLATALIVQWLFQNFSFTNKQTFDFRSVISLILLICAALTYWFFTDFSLPAWQMIMIFLVVFELIHLVYSFATRK